jgi:eukaryotic-like serine/threonine-protein kinase
MRGEPSANLIDLLSRLKLATAAEAYSVASRVRRLAGELPDFESVWVDALAQARVLTPFEAAEINAGRGEGLLRGPYVILRPLPSPHFADCFTARHFETNCGVRLYVVRRSQVPAATATLALAHLAKQLAPLRGPTAAVLEDSGFQGDSLWAACPYAEGTTAADWMVENGRLPPQVVMHIAREMAARLTDLERLGTAHGDVSAAGLVLLPSGHIVLPMAGLRAIVRPAEGYGFNDLQPEAYDCLAPERIAEGTAPTIASDLYACGCLWWHLLTGRAPFPGGNSLAKLRAVHAAKVVDVRQFAPDVPDDLARAIALCMAHRPSDRPASMAQLSTLLGSPSRAGSAALARCLQRQTQIWQEIWPARSRRKSVAKRLPIAGGIATVAALLIVGLWPVWRTRYAPRPASISAGRSPGKASLAERTPPEKAAPSSRDSQSPIGQRSTNGATAAAVQRPIADRSLDDLVLPGGNILRPEQLDLKPGQVVRGRPGQRPLVSVPVTGLVVNCENVCFEGIDFVGPSGAGSPGNPNRRSAMLVVAAQGIELRGCSFSSTAETPPIAIAWTGAAPNAAGVGGELNFIDCVFSGVSAIVDCQSDAALVLEVQNTLCVASGPILRLHRGPKPDQSIAISLNRATLRGDSAVLECRYGRLQRDLGSITISATDSVLAGNPGSGLLILVGLQRPDWLLKSIAWNGEGSLVMPETAVALWRASPSQLHVLPEDELDVAGLVRSDVTFGGDAEGAPSASRITRWQVPLRSAEPPGASTNSLFLPPNREKCKN